MVNPFAKYAQPQEEENPFAKYAQPVEEPATQGAEVPAENPFAKYAAPAAPVTTGPNPFQGQGVPPVQTQAPPTAPKKESHWYDFLTENEKAQYDLGKMVGEDVFVAAKDTPTQMAAALAANLEGNDPRTVFGDKDWKDTVIEDARKRAKEARQVEGEDTEYLLGIKRSSLRNLPQNLSFSLVSMGEGLAAGVPAFFAGSLASPAVGTVAGYTAGAGASGLAAYRMDTNMFLRDLREHLDTASTKVAGKPLTDEQFIKLAPQYEKLVQEHGAWEALPEALSNVIGAKLGKAIFKEAALGIKGMIGTTAKVGGEFLNELGTETITQIGQHNVEVDAGMTNEPKRSFTSYDDVKKSAQEVLPDVLLLSGVVAGGSRAAGTATRLYKEAYGITGTETPEGAALRGLDEIVDEDEAREAAERKESIDDFIAQQRAGAGAQPGAGVAGVSGVGAAEAAGVSDTGVPSAPPTGGLAGAGAAPTVAGAGAGFKLGSLEETQERLNILTRQRDRLEAAIEDAKYEGDYDGMQELQQQIDQELQQQIDQYNEQIAALQQQLQTQRVEPTTIKETPTPSRTYGETMKPLVMEDVLDEKDIQDPLLVAFVNATDKISRAEKISDPKDWTKEQKEAWQRKDWETFSRLRGYTENEIADYKNFLSIYKEVEKKYGQDYAAGISYAYNIATDRNGLGDTYRQTAPAEVPTTEPREYKTAREAEQEQRKARIREVVTANVIAAVDQVGEYRDADEAADAYRGNVFDTLQEQGIELDDYEYNYAQQQFDKALEEARQAAQPKAEEVIKEEKPTADIAALEAKESAAFDEVKRIQEAQLALLTKAGRRPAKNSPARRKYDALEKDRINAHWNWVEADFKLDKAKKGITLPTTDPVATAVERAQQLYDANPEYSEDEQDAAYVALEKELKAARAFTKDQIEQATDAFGNKLLELEKQRQQSEGRDLPNVRAGYSNVDESLADLVPQNQHGINRINQLWNEGKITYFEYTREMNKLTERLADRKLMRSVTRSNLPRERGFGRVVKALEDAARDGKIPDTFADMAIWFLTQNRFLAADLAISIGEPTDRWEKYQARTAEALYRRTLRLIRIFTNQAGSLDDRTGVHEILHHLERMLPENMRQLIRTEWRKRIEDTTRRSEKRLAQLRGEIETQEQKLKRTTDTEEFSKATQMLESMRAQAVKLEQTLEYLRLVSEANAAQDSGLFDQAIQMVVRGEVPHALYSLMDPSEFWAVNGSNLIAGRYDAAHRGRFARIAQYLREFIEHVRSVFGLDNESAIIRGLNAVLRGDGTEISTEMLKEGIDQIYPNIPPKGWTTAETEISEDEKKVIEQFKHAGDLRPDVVQAIRNNDLNGALNILAGRLTGFYGELATKLASLNLQTSIAFDNAANLTYRAIEQTAGPQLNRILNYIRVADPEYYADFFEGADKPENFAKLRAGIGGLYSDTLRSESKGKSYIPSYNYPPIASELRDVFGAIVRFDSTQAVGSYYDIFDAITLNSKAIEGIGNRVFLHEVVHAATVSLLRADPSQLTPEQLEARNDLEAAYRYAQKNIKVNAYGLRNIYEFVAEVFTNDEFRRTLKQIPYSPARTNILSRFFNAIMRLVGADNLASRAMVEAEKLFTATRYQETKPIGPLFAPGKKKGSYRKGPITDSWRSIEQLMASKMEWVKALPYVSNFLWNVATGPVRIKVLGALELRHLSDLTKTKFPQIASAVRIIEKMIAHRGQIMTEAASIAKDWMAAQKKNYAQSQLLGRVMLEATISGTEVDPTNTAYYDATRVHPKLKAAWDTLHPEFQDIYRRVRNFYKKQMEDAIQQMKDKANLIDDPEKRQKILDNIDRDFGPDKMKFPYFPLKRFGTYWFQVGEGTYKEFYKFESYTARELNYLKRKVQLIFGNAAQRELARTGMDKGNNISKMFEGVGDVESVLKTVNELVDSLSDDLVQLKDQEEREKTLKEVQDLLRSEINELLYTMMPQQSLRKQMINRRSIQGASEDMLRVFTNSATRIAYQQARAKYSASFVMNMNNARNYIQDMKGFRSPDELEAYRDFVYELEKRHKPILGLEDTSDSAKVAGIASDFVSIMTLTAPISAFLQTVGFYQFGVTQIGGRYGLTKGTERLLSNMKKYATTIPERTLAPLANGELLSIRFPSVMESDKIDGVNKLAAQQLIDEEQVNISQTYDLTRIGDRPSELTLSKWEATKRALFTPLHQMERFNREISLLTIFELEYEKLMSGPRRETNGIIVRDSGGNPVYFQNDATTPDGTAYSKEAYEMALDTAKHITNLTLGDTTRQMRPRYFMNAIPALVLKFKRYAFTALFNLYRNFKAGFITPFSKAELNQMREMLEADNVAPDVIEQKLKEMEEFRKELASEGRKALLGTLGVTSMFTGMKGLPLYSTFMPLIIRLLTDDDDDDEFFDYDNWFHNYMENSFGGYAEGMLVKMGMAPETARKTMRKTGEAIVSGPITVGTGGSFTERASLDVKSLLFRDPRYSPNTRQAVLENLVVLGGPVPSTILTTAEGVSDLFGPQPRRGVEKLLPAAFGKPLVAARYATEGAKTKAGDPLVEDLTSTEIAMQAIGLAPHRVVDAQRQAIQTKEKLEKIKAKRADIMDRIWFAFEAKDMKELAKIKAEAFEFSRKYPTYEITQEKIDASIDQRKKEQAIARLFGARIDEKDLPIVRDMLRYGER